jgi:hypothetical protein
MCSRASTRHRSACAPPTSSTPTAPPGAKAASRGHRGRSPMVLIRPASRNRATARCNSRGDAPTSAEAPVSSLPASGSAPRRSVHPALPAQPPARRLLAARAVIRGRDGVTVGADAFAAANALDSALRRFSQPPCADFRSHHLLDLPLQLQGRARHARPNRTLTTSRSTPPLNGTARTASGRCVRKL